MSPKKLFHRFSTSWDPRWSKRCRAKDHGRRRRSLHVQPLERRDLLAIFPVTSPLDVGPGTLRDAINLANANPGPDAIHFQVNNIQLTLGEILISDPLSIEGVTAPGGHVIISAAPGSRIFRVDDGLPTMSLVSMSNLTLRHGDSADGGAVLSHEDLTMRNSIVTLNRAGMGGGLSNRFGRLTLDQTQVYDNEAQLQGGGIMNNDGRLETRNSLIAANRANNAFGASTFGGGIQNLGRATATLIDTMVAGNSARVLPVPGAMGHGGGISTMLESSIHLIRSQVVDNDADHHGGGMFILDNSTGLIEQNSVVSGNTAGEAGGGLYLARTTTRILDSAVASNFTELRGGGISAGRDVILDVINSHVSDNSTELLNADGSGGGLYLSGFGQANGPQVMIVGSTIVRNNFGPSGQPGGEFGGGISARYGVRLTIDQTVIRENLASNSGGGIYASDRFTPHAPDITIVGTQIVSNQAGQRGGGVTMAGGRLDVMASTIQANTTSGRGGGFFLTGLGSPAPLNAFVRDSLISGNVADIEGGGVAAGPYLNLDVEQSRVIQNRTFGRGGGLYLTALNLPIAPHVTRIRNSEISRNLALYDPAQPPPLTSYASAAGLWGGPGAHVDMQNLTIAGNRAERFGGGMMFNEASFEVRNSTVDGNTANRQGGGAYVKNASGLFEQNTFHGNRAGEHGGAMFLHSFLQNRVTISHDTISLNQADANLTGQGKGGGIYIPNMAGNNVRTTLMNSIVADNYAGSILMLPHNDDLFDGPGLAGNPPVAATYNLVGSPLANTLVTANPDPNGNIVGTILLPANPQLGPLANNGGPTLTMTPQVGSPVINAGDPSFGPPPTFDQRGAPFDRVTAGRIDMGAIETQFGLPHPDLNGDGIVDCTDINLLTQAIASGVYISGFDMNGDGILNIVDIERWLCKAGNINLGPNQSYRFGDANLDGVVDGSDFGIWNSNKFTVNTAWCSGNFNGDNVVDGSDFNIWNANKFLGTVPCNPIPRPGPPCQSEVDDLNTNLDRDLANIEQQSQPLAPANVRAHDMAIATIRYDMVTDDLARARARRQRLAW